MREQDDNFVRLTYEVKDVNYLSHTPNRDEKMVWESKYTDIDGTELIRALYCMMVNNTWSEASVLSAMQDFVLENKDILDEETFGEYYWLFDKPEINDGEDD